MTSLENKRFDTLFVVRIVLVGLMFLAGAVLYARLPAMIPTHWGIDGNPNQWSPKIWGAWLIPLMSLVFLVLFPVLPKIDPRRENYEKFKQPWSVIQTAFIAFMAYIYAVTMFVIFYAQYDALVGRAVIFGIGILFVVLGNYLGKVRQNYFIGLRTPWTLNDPEVWQKSQRVAGWAFVLSGVVFIVESILWFALTYVFIGVLVLNVLVPIAYSYVISRSKPKAA